MAKDETVNGGTATESTARVSGVAARWTGVTHGAAAAGDRR